MDPEPEAPTRILDASGRPARRRTDHACPRCSAAVDRRIKSSGFGTPHDVCGVCGHDFHDEHLAP